MKHTKTRSKKSRNGSDGYSVGTGQAPQLHVAFLIDSMYGGGAELSVLTIIESLLQRNYKVDLVLLSFHGKRLSLIPDGTNLFVLDRNFQRAQKTERCSISVDEIHWIQKPAGITETIRGLFEYFRLLKIDKNVRLPTRGRHFHWIHSMSEYLKSEKPDLVVANLFHSYYVSILGRKLSLTEIPVIWSIRGDCLDFLNRKHRIYFNQLVRETQRVHALSKGLADSVVNYLDSHNVLTEPKEVTTIYNSFNTDRILSFAELPVEHDWFKPVGSGQVSGDTKLILSAGRLHDQKNYKLLINAFSVVLKEIDARLVIMGEGELREELENMVQDLNIAHAVLMPGWVDNPYSIMARANLFVSASNFEGFPRAITEAVICGCPIVSTDCPSGPREILEGGRWGYLTPVNDQEALVTAILESLSKDVDRSALKARGLVYDVDTIIEEYESLFHEVVNEFNAKERKELIILERTIRHWYKIYKYSVRSKIKQWNRRRIWDSGWYQNYRNLRINFRIWRTRQGWHRSFMKLRIRLYERAHLNLRSKSVPGTPKWLIESEIKYGGKIIGVPTQNSPLDPVGSKTLASGGDRMLHHGYAVHYAKFLDSYVQNRDQRIVICEVGVLEGTGLAIWCDLFPNARCIGLDIDLSNIQRNMDKLRSRGAFSKNSPELLEFDQLVYCADYVKENLNGDRIDVFADDGNHSEKAIMTTLKSVAPYLNEQFVYFVEDNWDIHKIIKEEYPQWVVRSDCGFTVITP